MSSKSFIAGGTTTNIRTNTGDIVLGGVSGGSSGSTSKSFATGGTMTDGKSNTNDVIITSGGGGGGGGGGTTSVFSKIVVRSDRSDAFLVQTGAQDDIVSVDTIA